MSVGAMEITFRLFGALRDTVGCKQVNLPWSDGTVREALVSFVEQQPSSARGFLFDSHGNLWRSLIVLVNDEPVADAQTSPVKVGDTISVLLPLAGGKTG